MVPVRFLATLWVREHHPSICCAVITEDSILEEIIETVKWGVGHTGPAYLDYENQKKLSALISKGRSYGVFRDRTTNVLKVMLSTGSERYIEHKELIRNQPRKDAQKFIAKKNVRKWLFDRDRICLCCGSNEHLTVDHIVPVNRGGKNQLSNLQTLCRSCNSWKSDSYIDFRI